MLFQGCNTKAPYRHGLVAAVQIHYGLVKPSKHVQDAWHGIVLSALLFKDHGHTCLQTCFALHVLNWSDKTAETECALALRRTAAGFC